MISDRTSRLGKIEHFPKRKRRFVECYWSVKPSLPVVGIRLVLKFTLSPPLSRRAYPHSWHKLYFEYHTRPFFPFLFPPPSRHRNGFQFFSRDDFITLYETRLRIASLTSWCGSKLSWLLRTVLRTSLSLERGEGGGTKQIPKNSVSKENTIKSQPKLKISSNDKTLSSNQRGVRGKLGG